MAAEWYERLLHGTTASPPPPSPVEDEDKLAETFLPTSAPPARAPWFERLLAQGAPQSPATPQPIPDPGVVEDLPPQIQLRRSTAPSPLPPGISMQRSPQDALIPGQTAPAGPMALSPEVPRIPPPEVRSMPERLGSAVVRGVEDVNRGVLGAVEAAGEDVAAAGQRAQEEGFAFARPLFELVEQAGSELAQLGRQSVPEETAFSKPAGESGSLPEDIAQALPSFATGIGAGLVGGPGVAMAVLGAQETGGQYLRERQDGKPHEEAVQSAVTYGVASALLERYGVSKVLENAFPGAARGKALDFAKRYVRASLAEGGTEAIQDVASNLTTVLTEASRRGMDFDALADVFSEENLRQYGRTALVSSILGGGTVAAGALAPGQTESTPVDSTRSQGASTPTPPSAASGSSTPPEAAFEGGTFSPSVTPPPSPEAAPSPGTPLPGEGVAVPEVPSHAGQSGESPEAIARVSRGERTFRVTRSGEVLPILNTVDAVDVRVNPGEAKVRLTAGGDFDIEQGGQGTVAQRAAISRLREGRVPELAETLLPTEEGQPLTFELDVGEGLPSEAPVAPQEAAPAEPAEPASLVERLPAAREGRGDEAGFVRSPGRDLIRDVRIAIDRQIKPQGNLPVSAWKLKLQKDHNLGAHEKGIEFRLRELNQKIRKYKGPLTKKQLTRYLGDALRGSVPIELRAETAGMDERQVARAIRKGQERGASWSTVVDEFTRVQSEEPSGLGLAPEFAPLIAKLRADIDSVTRSLRREGLLDDAAARNLERSHGLYVHRSYEAFRGKSKEYLRRVEGQPLWNRAHELVAQEHPDFTPEEVDGFLREFIERGDRPTLPGNVPEGALNRSVLLQRKGVRDLERLLLGERRDVRSEAVDTIIGQVALLEHHRFLKALREDGLGKYLFERPRGRFYRNIDEIATPLSILEQGEGQEPEARTIYRKATHRRYGEMTASGKPGGQALHTTPEILRELEEAAPHPSEWPTWLKIWSMGNFLVKANLTVLSPTTTGRNYLSNTFAAMANGYGPWGRGFKEGKSLVFRDIANSSNEQLRERYMKLRSLGILDQNADYGDLRRMGEFADLMRVEQDPGGRPASWVKAFARKAGAVYAHGDNFWKVLGFYKERARLERAYRAYPEWSDVKLDEEAAGIVRRVLQNYAELPRLARSISANPVVAPFFSFTWAMYRNANQTMKQGAKEVRSENPVIRRVGYTRQAGMAVALALPEMLTFALRWYANVDEEDDKALREFVYPWDRSSTLGIVAHKPGEYTYFNWGFMDYFSRLKEPLRLLLQVGKEEREPAEAVDDLLADYGEEILFGALIDIARGETADGYRVWLEKDDFEARVEKSMAHLWRTGRPGAARNIANINEAAQGEGSRKLWAEIVALLGPRFTTVDVRDRLDRYGKGFSRDLAEATRVYSQFANRSSNPGAENLLDGYRRANEERMKLLRDLRRKIDAAIVSGIPEPEVEDILVNSEVPVKYLDMAWGGYFEPVDYARGKHWEKHGAELERLAREAEIKWMKENAK